MAFGIAEVVSGAIGPLANLIDELFTSDEERLDKKAMLERINQIPGLAQIKLNTTEAAHRSVWVAGWRPFIGWVCGSSIAYSFVIEPLLSWLLRVIGTLHPETGLAQLEPLPALDTGPLFALIMGMLGMGTLRTYEKGKGISK